MISAEPIHRYTVETPLGPVTLASDERLVSIEPSAVLLPERREEPLDVLLRMAGVDCVAELGSRGPVIASAANEENAANPELRRYEAKFGRDALYAAEFLADVHPQLEDGTVRYFAAYQAVRVEPSKQASPGKIPNHIRDPSDPLARRLTYETGRGWPWFGATDATIQFLLSACRTLDRSPEQAHEVIRYPFDHAHAGHVVLRNDRPLTLAMAIRSAAAWLVRKLSGPIGRDLVWAGLNRKDSFTVWTDSPNAFHHRNGALARPPVAPVQVQSQTYDALMALAQHAAVEPTLRLDAGNLRARAERVRAAILDHYVVEDDRGTYLASGLECANGALHPLAVRTVSMGFLLDSRVLDGPDLRTLRDGLVEQLFGPAMTTPFGFAGRARDEIRYEPFDYHSQVWAFAVHKVGRGLARHGYANLAAEADDRVLRQTRDGLLPENVGGEDAEALRLCPHVLTVERPGPDGRMTRTVKERPPAPYAAWTVAAVLAIQAGRGA